MSEPDEIIFDGPTDAPRTIAFAHGAGAPMDSDVMTAYAQLLAETGFRVARFEFDYMAQRRGDAKRRPPDRQPKLLARFTDIVQRLASSTDHLLLGGKSMGGRMATILAAEDPAICAGVVVFGYPFHPPGKPDRLRLDHFPALTKPVLICQGERDPFGKRDEVADYALPPAVKLHWAPDGDHDLKPRKASGLTGPENWRGAARAAAKLFL